MNDVIISGRLHPATPLRRSWVQLSALGWLAYGQLDNLHRLTDKPWGWWAVAGIVLLAVGLFGGGALVSWARTSFTLSASDLSYGYGWMHRVQRTFPIDQIRTVDVSRPLWARLLRVAELTVSTQNSNQKISCLSVKDAERLRAAVLQLVHGEELDGEEAGEGIIARVDSVQLAMSILLDARMMVRLVVGAGIAVTPYLVTDHALSLALAIPWLRTAWRATARRFPAHHGWTVREVTGGYRTEHGMFHKNQYTWQRDRMTSVTLHQPVLWRSRNWVKVTGGTVGFGSALILPVATRTEAEKLLVGLMGIDVLKVLDTHRPLERSARWCTPFWRACGYSESPGFFAGWRGMFLRQSITVVRTDRALAVRTGQGIWQRRHGRVTVGLRMPGGDDVWAVHREKAEGEKLAARLRAMVLAETVSAQPIRRIRLEDTDRVRLGYATGT